MAAMAQQDCGQCGYNCNDYSAALFTQSETRLNLCVPGGKETARMLKQLYQELESAPAAVAPPTPATPVPGALLGRSRDNPVNATFLSRRLLNKPGSQKETWHIDIDLADTDLDYAVGDFSGFFPPTIPTWSRPCLPRLTRRRIFPSAIVRCAKSSPMAPRCRQLPICCLS